jgi:PAS domain S-box-containing protein
MNETALLTDIQPQELRIFEAVPGNNVLIKADFPRFTIIGVSDSYTQLVGRSRTELIGKGVFEAFLPNPASPEDSEVLMASFEEVIATKKVSNLPVHRYDVKDNLNLYVNKFWKIINSPVIDHEGNVIFIVNSVKDITNEITVKQQKEQIKESKQRLDMAIEIAELGIFNIDLQRGTATYNQQIMDWLGLKEQQLPMTELLSNVYQEDLEMVTRELESTLNKQSGGRHNIIFRVIHPETGQMQYLNSIGQVQFEGERAVTIKGVMQNVTEQVLANQKLKENEQKLHSIIENAPFAIAVLKGKEMRIELANQNILDVWGKGDVIGKTYYEIVPELGFQEVFEHLKKSYETGLPVHIRQHHLYFMVEGEKHHYYFNYSFIPLFDDTGKVYATTVTAADVTDLIIARQKIEESSANLTNFIMQSPVGMCILKGPNHIIEIANDSQLELWGRDRDSVMHKPVLEALPEGRSQGVEEILNKVYTTGEIYRAYELPVKMFRNGQMESFYVNVEHRPYIGTNGRIEGIMSVSTEITELVLARHKIEEVVAKRTRELAEANEALQENNKELEQFAYVAAHDLQEPLRTISNFVGLFVKKYGTIDKEADTYTQYILNATAKMKSLINHLLDYSRTGKNNPFQNVDLNEVLNEVMTEMDQTLKEKKVKITVTALPVIWGNKTELKRLFQNLISNGIKFQKPDNIPHIDISVEQHDREYLFAFKDNGIGIEEKYMEKLFVIFQRLHNVTDYPGTGIGLATCKKIVALHGGRIGVKSEFGSGSTFYFTIPKEK